MNTLNMKTIKIVFVDFFDGNLTNILSSITYFL